MSMKYTIALVDVDDTLLDLENPSAPRCKPR